MKKYYSCNFCGADDFAVLFSTDFGQVLRCRSCDLMCSSLRGHFDPVIEYEAAPKETRGVEQYLKKQVIQLKDYNSILPVLDELFPNKGKLLEVGTFVGTFLQFMKEKGWDVTGIEPIAWCVEYARENLGLNLRNVYIKDAHFPDESFDVVAMFHVIEHLTDVKSDIADLYKALKPNGLLIIETPRFDTIWFRMLKGRERNVIHDHLYYFTEASLKKYLIAGGFKPVKTETTGRTLTLDRVLLNLVRITGSKRLFNVYDTISPKLGLENRTVYLNTRDMMRIYAVKQDSNIQPDEACRQ